MKVDGLIVDLAVGWRVVGALVGFVGRLVETYVGLVGEELDDLGDGFKVGVSPARI